LYVEDIDSFAKVRDVNPDIVAGLLTSGGFFSASEERVQIGLEKILKESFHKKDWPGEYNDLYTSNVVVNGTRRATAFLLKGNGIQVQTMGDKALRKEWGSTGPAFRIASRLVRRSIRRERIRSHSQGR
jgi:hypothetical protein